MYRYFLSSNTGADTWRNKEELPVAITRRLLPKVDRVLPLMRKIIDDRKSFYRRLRNANLAVSTSTLLGSWIKIIKGRVNCYFSWSRRCLLRTSPSFWASNGRSKGYKTGAEWLMQPLENSRVGRCDGPWEPCRCLVKWLQFSGRFQSQGGKEALSCRFAGRYR